MLNNQIIDIPILLLVTGAYFNVQQTIVVSIFLSIELQFMDSIYCPTITEFRISHFGGLMYFFFSGYFLFDIIKYKFFNAKSGTTKLDTFI